MRLAALLASSAFFRLSCPSVKVETDDTVNLVRVFEQARIERLLSPRASREAAPICQKITAWVDGYRREISKTYEKRLDADLDFLTDRNAEIWIPLFSICALAAPERVPELRECAQALCLNKVYPLRNPRRIHRVTAAIRLLRHSLAQPATPERYALSLAGCADSPCLGWHSG